jgi:hypothetical protein
MQYRWREYTLYSSFASTEETTYKTRVILFMIQVMGQ